MYVEVLDVLAFTSSEKTETSSRIQYLGSKFQEKKDFLWKKTGGYSCSCTCSSVMLQRAALLFAPPTQVKFTLSNAAALVLSPSLSSLLKPQCFLFMPGHLSVLCHLWRWGMVNNKTWWYSARMLSPPPPLPHHRRLVQNSNVNSHTFPLYTYSKKSENISTIKLSTFSTSH